MRDRAILPLLVIVSLILGAGVLVARRPTVAERLWRAWGGYPKLSAYAAHIDSSPLPWRSWPRGVLQRAMGEAQQAAGAPSQDRATHFVSAGTLARVALILLYAPALVLFVPLGYGAGRYAMRFLARRIDLESALVRLDTSSVPRPVIRLPEVRLPLPPPRAAIYDVAEEDVPTYQRLLALARREGLGSAALTAELGRHPLAKVSSWRALLAADLRGFANVGLSRDDLRRYEDAWACRPSPHPDLPRSVNRVAVTLGWRRAWRLLGPAPDLGVQRQLLRGGVPPELLRVREELRLTGQLTPLHERLLGILAAHPRHPASIDHHDAGDGGLLHHKLLVLRKGLEMFPTIPGSDAPAALTCIVAHDLGKTVSYEPSGGGWSKLDDLHAQNTALIVAGLEEFYREHSADDQQRILLALKYDHDARGIPLAFASGCEPLCEIVRRADGEAVERSEDSISHEASVDRVIAVLPTMVRDMAINRVGRSTRPDGFFERGPSNEDVLLVLEARFRELLKQYLDRDTQRSLGLWTKRIPGELHPAWEHLARALLEQGILPRLVRGVPFDPGTKLYSVIVHERLFRAVFAINTGWLVSQIGDLEYHALVRHWLSRAKVDLKTLVPGVAGRDDEPSRGDAPTGAAPGAPDERCPACGSPLKLGPRVLRCTAPRQRCGVRYVVRGGEIVRNCKGCEKPLRVVRPRDHKKPPFLGCPDPDDCPGHRPTDGAAAGQGTGEVAHA